MTIAIDIITETSSRKIHKIETLILGILLIFPRYGCTKLLKGVNAEAPPPAESWVVVKVSDGDTLKVRQTNGQELKIRLCGIDAPATACKGSALHAIT